MTIVPKYYLIIDNKGNPLAVASSLNKVEEYITDTKNHKKYYERKVKLNLERRKHNVNLNIAQPRNNTKHYGRELTEVKLIISKKPHLANMLQVEVDRLTGLISEEKALKAKRLEEYELAKKNAEEQWYNSLSDEDKMIYDGNWDHAENLIVPTHRQINFIG